MTPRHIQPSWRLRRKSGDCVVALNIHLRSDSSQQLTVTAAEADPAHSGHQVQKVLQTTGLDSKSSQGIVLTTATTRSPEVDGKSEAEDPMLLLANRQARKRCLTEMPSPPQSAVAWIAKLDSILVLQEFCCSGWFK